MYFFLYMIYHALSDNVLKFLSHSLFNFQFCTGKKHKDVSLLVLM